jgi:hypothetical protein
MIASFFHDSGLVRFLFFGCVRPRLIFGTFASQKGRASLPDVGLPQDLLSPG